MLLRADYSEFTVIRVYIVIAIEVLACIPFTMSFVNFNLSNTANAFPKALHGNRTGIELYILHE